MLIFLIWVGTMFPKQYNDAIRMCEKEPRNQCILLGQPHWYYYAKKYRSMLNMTDERLKIMLPAQRGDILRLLALYEHGGLFTDLDSEVNYDCLYNLIKNYNVSFFAQEQIHPLLATNALIYAPHPFDPQIERFIRSMYQTPGKYLLDFTGPRFLNSLPIKIVNVRKCVNHLYKSVWRWWDRPTNYTVRPAFGQTYMKCLKDYKSCQAYQQQQSASNCQKLKQTEEKQLKWCKKSQKRSQLLLRSCQQIAKRCPQHLSDLINNFRGNQSKTISQIDNTQETESFIDISLFTDLSANQNAIIITIASLIACILGFITFFAIEKCRRNEKFSN